jgi:leucyl aminopeptidase
MAYMNSIAFKVAANPTKVNAKTIIIQGVLSIGESGEILTRPNVEPTLNSVDLDSLDFRGRTEGTSRFISEGKAYGLVGLGKGITSPNQAREIGGAIGRAFRDQKTLVIDIPLSNATELLALIEGIAFVQYEFTKYKSSKPTPAQLTSVTLISPFKISQAQISKVQLIAETLNRTRNLVNTPGNDLYPEKLAQIFASKTKIPNLKVEIWDERRLAKEKCNGILAVGSGSTRGPRLVKISYTPPNAKAHLALVGKGITFDTGGISLKPKTEILGMKYDMAGAATVGEATLAIAKLGLPVKVTTFLCIAENMPSGTATRPNDVVTFRNGKSVEITNTDAEGRIVMADGLILASELKPDLIVDLATLTGAARVALGNRYSGLMGDDLSVEMVENAAREAGELVWHMPLPEELFDLIQSDVADMMNSRVGNPTGGMLVAGLFLREFIGEKSKKDKSRLNWAHLDFATAANNDMPPYGATVKGATGSMIRTLISLAEQLGTKPKK